MPDRYHFLYLCLFFFLPAARGQSYFEPGVLHQPDSIIRLCHVKTRESSYAGPASKVEHFNRRGQVIEAISYIPPLGKMYYRLLTSYNDSGRKIKETYYNYSRYDKVNKKMLFDTLTVDSVFMDNTGVYDSLNRPTRKWRKNKLGEITYECSYSYNPTIRTCKGRYDPDTAISSSTEIFDDHDLPIELSSVSIYPRDTIQSRMQYENNYDKHGRLAKRRISRSRSSKLSGNSHSMQEDRYKYNSAGLLKKIISRADKIKIQTRYNYEYWD